MNRNRSGRRYDREFKNNAVALVRGGQAELVQRRFYLKVMGSVSARLWPSSLELPFFPREGFEDEAFRLRNFRHPSNVQGISIKW